MDDGNLLALKLDEDSTTGNVDTEMVPLDQMKMDVEEPIVVLGIEDEVRQFKEYVVYFRDEEKKENEIEEVSTEEGSEEEVRNDENPNDEVSFGEDLEEEMKNDENPEEEVSIEEDPEEEVKNDENPKEEVKNEVKNERKFEAISKNKVSKLRKRPKLFQKKKIALGKKVGTVDTEVATHTEMVETSYEENTKEDEQKEGDTTNEAKAKEKLEANLKRKVNNVGKIGKNKKKALRRKNEVVVKNRENPEYSKMKTTMKGKSTGMIFMCSSKTKKDCYDYQVFGLPASKRDIVFEIYEGMKLFLFDYDLKLMYGIYEAAGPGGYNIEPKAFKSAFPSQVRFTVLEDCLPLTEEKFKSVIKDNYYCKNKFHCQLNSNQVKNLCKLFSVASKGSTSKWLQGSQQAEAPTFVDHVPKGTRRIRKAESPQAEAPTFGDSESKWPLRSRKAESPRAEDLTFVGHECKRPRWSSKPENRQTEASKFVGRESKRPHRSRNTEGHQAEAPIFVGRQSKRTHRSRKPETCTFVGPKSKRLRQILRTGTQEFSYQDSRHRRWEDKRHHVFARYYLYSEDHVAYRRQAYESSVQHPSLGQPSHPPLGSAFLPSSERENYRRDQLQYRDLRPLDVDLGCRDEFERRDSHTISRHRYNFDHRGSYMAYRRHTSYHDHDPSSSVGHQSEYYTLASRRRGSKYHLSAGPPHDYRHH